MNRTDYVFVGLKLLGVVFAVYGVISLVAVVAGLIISLQQQDARTLNYFEHYPMNWFQYLQPSVYLICGIVLTRWTNWCLRWICFEDQLDPEHDDANQPVL